MILNLFTVVRQKITKLFYFIIIIMITSNLCLLFLMKKNFASIVFNLIKMIFFTNVKRYGNFVREKLKEVIKKCNNCNTNCLNDLCLLIHQEKVCPKYIKCTTCGRYQDRIHVCDGSWCLNCSPAVIMDHKCFILTQEERDEIKKTNVNG
jgi:hypothetical protein